MTKDKIKKLDFDTVALSDDGRALVIIDQTLLPGEMKFIRLSEQRDIREAIYRLQVRGAPAIGVAAAIGIYLAALEISENVSEEDTFFEKLSEAKIYLQEARPTAVNLRWALDRMYDFALSKKGLGPEVIAAQMKGEALAIRDEDIEVCRKIGVFAMEQPPLLSISAASGAMISGSLQTRRDLCCRARGSLLLSLPEQGSTSL